MASIAELKATLAQAVSLSNTTRDHIRAATESAEQIVARLRGVTDGSTHPKCAEAIKHAEQARQRLQEATKSIQGSSHAAREFISILG